MEPSLGRVIRLSLLVLMEYYINIIFMVPLFPLLPRHLPEINRQRLTPVRLDSMKRSPQLGPHPRIRRAALYQNWWCGGRSICSLSWWNGVHQAPFRSVFDITITNSAFTKSNCKNEFTGARLTSLYSSAVFFYKPARRPPCLYLCCWHKHHRNHQAKPARSEDSINNNSKSLKFYRTIS